MKGFKYEKFKEELKGNDSSWGSYSDLFMVLSFVFLMMYVVSSLKSGTNSVQSRLEKQQVARENDDLRAQIKAYNSLKDAALQDESEKEQEIYKELMNKLSLLKEEAKFDKERLRKEAQENEKKEMALNRYQQIVRNIINANLLAKNKLNVREEIIAKKNVVITDLNKEVEAKKQEINQNNQQIQKINKELDQNIKKLQTAQAKSKLSKKNALAQIEALKNASMNKISALNKENEVAKQKLEEISNELNKTSQQLATTENALHTTNEKLVSTVEQYENQINSLQQSHSEKMAKERDAFENKLKTAKMTALEKAKQLAEFNRKANEKDKQLQREIASLKENLTEAEERELAKANENEKLSNELAQTQNQITSMRAAHETKMTQERADFENKIKAASMSAAQKAQQLAEFNKKAKEKDQQLQKEIASLKENLTEAEKRELAKANENEKLSNELAQTQNQISNMKEAHESKMAQERAAFENKINAAKMSAHEKARELVEFNRKAREKDEALNQKIAGLKESLADAEERANARAKLSKEIAEALKTAGVDANVNPNTGDVIISFGDDYFDMGSSSLKPTMTSVLQKFVPKYSESLFKDPKIASKITSVEILGFASPTYKGKYIDPQSLDPLDQKAAKYNLDLSYKRARSIFDYMFDTNKIKYNNQKKLLSLVKVTGRSFFNEGRTPQGATPGMDQKEFCAKFDCKQAQKVIIKFNMDDKK